MACPGHGDQGQSLAPGSPTSPYTVRPHSSGLLVGFRGSGCWGRQAGVVWRAGRLVFPDLLAAALIHVRHDLQHAAPGLLFDGVRSLITCVVGQLRALSNEGVGLGLDAIEVRVAGPARVGAAGGCLCWATRNGARRRPPWPVTPGVIAGLVFDRTTGV